MFFKNGIPKYVPLFKETQKPQIFSNKNVLFYIKNNTPIIHYPLSESP